MVEMTKVYDRLFRKHARKVGLDWHLLKAQAYVESGLDPQAVSPVGAKGIAQFMPATWQDWGEGDVFNPDACIKAQSRYMVWLINKFIDADDPLKFGVAAYNWGVGNVRKVYKRQKKFFEAWIAMPGETQRYVAKVIFFWEKLRRGG